MSSALDKKNTEAYDGNLMDSYGFPKVSGLFKQTNVSSNVNYILQRKSDVSRAIDTTRHTTDGTSITKQPKIPSSQAVTVVSAQKMVGTSIFHPSKQEYVSDIATFQQFQGASTVSGKAIPSKRKHNKNPFGDSPIFDADYVDMESSGKYKVSRVSRKPSEAPRKASKEDDIVWITDAEESSRKFRKAPAKDAWDLGLAHRTKSVEPSAISAISETKTKAKQNLKKRPVQQVTAADAFDHLVDVFTGKGKSGDVQTAPKVKKHSLISNIVHAYTM